MTDQNKLALFFMIWGLVAVIALAQSGIDNDKLEAENKEQTQTIYKQQQEINTLERRIESLGRII